MRSTRSTLKLPAIGLLFTLVAVFAYQAGAGRPQARPSSVAVINLPRVLEGLRQRGDAEANLKAIADEIVREQEARQAELQSLDAQRQNMTDARQKQEIEEQIARKALSYQGWLQFANNKLDVERSLLMQNLYRSIKEAVQAMADAEGYDVVLMDDSEGELSINPQAQVSREVQVQQQIGNRRVLYANGVVNMTDDLIARMNSTYTSGVGTP